MIKKGAASKVTKRIYLKQATPLVKYKELKL